MCKRRRSDSRATHCTGEFSSEVLVHSDYRILILGPMCIDCRAVRAGWCAGSALALLVFVRLEQIMHITLLLQEPEPITQLFPNSDHTVAELIADSGSPHCTVVF